MADKKKKIITLTTKESTPVKRPVILKSDRETSKDPLKEKSEREKPPTILLKAREPSTPKDQRPSSPKPVDDSQPSKIAQNENKEKKTIEQKIQTIVKMKEPVKLVDENLEFNSSAVEFLQDACTNYLVIGIIGSQGVGKSMIMNLIAHDKDFDDICNNILLSHENQSSVPSEEDAIVAPMDNLSFTDKCDSKKYDEINDFKFKMQDIDQIEKGLHCTKGIDMYVTDDRIILLDCQPLWSPSLLEESSLSSSIIARSVNTFTVECLQLTSYLIAICHVLIAVQDWFTDYNFLRYIQAAEMLKPSLASPHAQSAQDGGEACNNGDNNPHFLLLHNRCQLEDFIPENVKYMQELYKKVFQKSNLQLNSGLYLYNDTNKNGMNIEPISKGYNVDKCGLPINLFLLPEIYDDFENKDIYRGHPSFEKLAERLRWMVLGVQRHQITNNSYTSEKSWFHYCNKTWETIRKCTFYMEYERFLP